MGEEIRLFCKQCHSLLCRDCVVFSHRDHEVVSIADAARGEKEILSCLTQDVAMKLQEAHSEANRLHKMLEELDERADQSSAAIERRFSELSDALSARQKILKAQLESMKALKLSSIAQLCREVDVCSARLEKAELFTRQTLDNCDDAGILTMSDVISRGLVNYLGTPIFSASSENSRVCFIDAPPLLVETYGRVNGSATCPLRYARRMRPYQPYPS